MKHLANISTTTLAARRDRLITMRANDRQRYAPNPNGPGYLTRNERYSELIRAIQDELHCRFHRWIIA